MDRRVCADDLILAFYNLFSLYEEKYYVGSREQARILLQESLNSYIPSSIIDKLFRIFIRHSIILSSDEKATPNALIGKKYFVQKKQKKYMLNKSIDLNAKIEILRYEVADLLIRIQTMPLDEDILLLRNIEKEKGVKFSEVIAYNSKTILNRSFSFASRSYTSQFDEDSDMDLKYYFAREEIMDIVEKLRRYDPEEVSLNRIKLQKKILKYCPLDNQFLNKFDKKIKESMNNQENLVAKLYTLTIDDNYDVSKTFVGVVKVESIEFNESQVVLNNNYTQIFIDGFTRPYLEHSDKPYIEIEGSNLLAVFDLDAQYKEDELEYLHLLQYVVIQENLDILEEYY